MSAYAALKGRLQEIDVLIRGAEAARYLPTARANDVRAISMVNSRYNSSGLTDAQKIIAARMTAIAIVEEQAAGEIARDRELKRLAVILDQLRRDLPALAEAARFELLDVAREMRS